MTRITGCMDGIRDNLPLLRALVMRDIKGRYKSSNIGFLWHFVAPAVTVTLIYIMFTSLRTYLDPDYWILVASGLLPFMFFRTGPTKGSVALLSKASMIKKMAFPRELIVVAQVVDSLISMVISYVVLVAAIILFDVGACIPFSRLREQGKAKKFVTLKLFNIVLQTGFAFGFGAAGLFSSEFGVGWAFVANLAASVLTFVAMMTTISGVRPRIDWVLLGSVFVYSLPLLVSGIAGTANEFIDRQMIKYLVPDGAMSQLGIYGAITKIAVVMMLFTQMYRLAAEPFFLANYRKDDFKAMNAGALKYYIIASMLIFLGIALFKDLFALIVGREFRQGIFILPVVLGANVLSGVWLNLSFWYKREERTSLAMVVTFTGLVFTVGCNIALVPRFGYYGAAWARFASEAAMVAVSYWLNRRYYPTPYDIRRIVEYVVTALAVYAASVVCDRALGAQWAIYCCNLCLVVLYGIYVVRREKIDLAAMMRSVLKRN